MSDLQPDEGRLRIEKRRGKWWVFRKYNTSTPFVKALSCWNTGKDTREEAEEVLKKIKRSIAAARLHPLSELFD